MSKTYHCLRFLNGCKAICTCGRWRYMSTFYTGPWTKEWKEKARVSHRDHKRLEKAWVPQ